MEKNTIYIKVIGGLISDIDNIPEGITIKILDYDIQGAEEDRLTKDEEGEDCVESIWEG